MKAIMISMQPQWVEKILNGEKTIEIRKSKPSCELPCKVYIYCTMPNKQENRKPHSWEVVWLKRVVAEFTLNKVEKIKFDCPCSFRSFNLGFGFTENRYNIDITKTCLTESELYDYLGEPCELQGEYHQTFEFGGYAWYIDNLKIYDKPKELSEFSHYIPNNKYPKKGCGIDCEDCMSYDSEHETCLALYYSHWQIKRPPQSWCYVEEIGNE